MKIIAIFAAMFLLSCEPEEVTDCEGLVNVYLDLDCKNESGQEANLISCYVRLDDYGEEIFDCANLKTCEEILACNAELKEIE